jgi:hypothetical protein
VGRKGYKVIHMLNAGSPLAKPDQAIEVKADDELERAVIDLVGDLAAYKPGAKLVFIEGGGSTPFDEKLIVDLFPQFAASVNLITSGNKARVQQVSALLDRARSAGAAVGRAFAITDRDNDQGQQDSPNCYRWDRYHIENYLLEPDFVAKVVIGIGLAKSVDVRADELFSILKGCAADTLHDLVRHELESESHASLSAALSTSTRRGESFDVSALRGAVLQSYERMGALLDGVLSKESLLAREAAVRARFEDDLNSGAWIKTFRGRDILKRFLAKHLNGCLRYEILRNMIVSHMVDANFRPEGIVDVLAKIEGA